MSDNSTKTVLVTGATSGLGFEAAAQFAEAGYGNVTITGRTDSKAEEARSQLVARTSKDVFSTLAVDLSQPASVQSAAAELASRGDRFDVALLNAGMVSGSELVRTSENVEITFASSLIGHHQLTMSMLADSLLSPTARIIIAGSEAARGDVPTFGVIDLAAFAEKSSNGDLEKAAESLIRGDSTVKYKPANAYANAKLFVAWWAAELGRRLPEGMTVNAVSPGSAPDTQAARNANFFMSHVMMPIMKRAPARLGLAATVPVAAKRFIEAAEFGTDVTGQFFASAPKKMTGRLHRVELAHVDDQTSQAAAWTATVRVAGNVDYPSHV